MKTANNDLHVARLINKIRHCDNQLDKTYGVVDHSTRQMFAVARRHAYHLILHEKTNLPFRLVGEIVGRGLGQRSYDHSTVMNNIKKARVLIDAKDTLFMSVYNDSKQILSDL